MRQRSRVSYLKSGDYAYVMVVGVSGAESAFVIQNEKNNARERTFRSKNHSRLRKSSKVTEWNRQTVQIAPWPRRRVGTLSTLEIFKHDHRDYLRRRRSRNTLHETSENRLCRAALSSYRAPVVFAEGTDASPYTYRLNITAVTNVYIRFICRVVFSALTRDPARRKREPFRAVFRQYRNLTAPENFRRSIYVLKTNNI